MSLTAANSNGHQQAPPPHLAASAAIAAYTYAVSCIMEAAQPHPDSNSKGQIFRHWHCSWCADQLKLLGCDSCAQALGAGTGCAFQPRLLSVEVRSCALAVLKHVLGCCRSSLSREREDERSPGWEDAKFHDDCTEG
eukprot:1138204-Pelagomonas_calceolata.AAC.3